MKIFVTTKEISKRLVDRGVNGNLDRVSNILVVHRDTIKPIGKAGTAYVYGDDAVGKVAAVIKERDRKRATWNSRKARVPA